MALGAVLGAALTNHAAHPWGLYVGGVDVAKDEVASRYGTRIEDIELQLNGAGDVSSISFPIDDVLGQLAFTDGAEVRLVDLSRNVTWFRGWLESYEATAQPPTGRYWAITAVGVEIVLDWYVTSDNLTFPIGMSLAAMLQSIVASAVGVGPLRVGIDTVNLSGSDALPIGQIINASLSTSAITVPASTYLREAMAQAVSVASDNLPSFGSTWYPVQITVDHNYGLRAWAGAVNGPTAAFDARAAVNPVRYVPSSSKIRLDASSIYRAVVVRGGGGVVVTVGDGSGKPGRTAILEDSTLLTVAAATAAGTQYLTEHLATLSGSVGLDYTPPNIGPGTEDVGAAIVLGSIELTDPTMLTAAQLFGIRSADVEFFADKPNVRVSFGDSRRSGARLIRRWSGKPLS